VTRLVGEEIPQYAAQSFLSKLMDYFSRKKKVAHKFWQPVPFSKICPKKTIDQPAKNRPIWSPCFEATLELQCVALWADLGPSNKRKKGGHLKKFALQPKLFRKMHSEVVGIT
jgi:hypothetical protein